MKKKRVIIVGKTIKSVLSFVLNAAIPLIQVLQMTTIRRLKNLSHL